MKTFNCRGYSVVSTNKVSDCFLHSEDSKVHGPRLLQENLAGAYFEKAPCLDSSFPARVCFKKLSVFVSVSITCTETYITVQFVPKMQFMGRMYMEGYSERPECSVKGQGTNTIILKLSALSEQCGLIKAIADDNRYVFIL